MTDYPITLDGYDDIAAAFAKAYPGERPPEKTSLSVCYDDGTEPHTCRWRLGRMLVGPFLYVASRHDPKVAAVTNVYVVDERGRRVELEREPPIEMKVEVAAMPIEPEPLRGRE